jgi:hypothetical protein
LDLRAHLVGPKANRGTKTRADPLTRLERLEGVDEIAERLEFGSFHDRFVVGLIEI